MVQAQLQAQPQPPAVSSGEGRGIGCCRDGEISEGIPSCAVKTDVGKVHNLVSIVVMEPWQVLLLVFVAGARES